MGGWLVGVEHASNGIGIGMGHRQSTLVFDPQKMQLQE